MQKTKNDKKPKSPFGFLNKMPIRKKITLMYSSFFSVLLIIISAIVIVNAYLFYEKTARDDMRQTLDSVEEFIREGNDITKEALLKYKKDSYTEIRVSSRDELDIITADDPEKYPRNTGIRAGNMPNRRFEAQENGNRQQRQPLNQERQAPTPPTGETRNNQNRTSGEPPFERNNDQNNFNSRNIGDLPYIIAGRTLNYNGTLYDITVYREMSHERAILALFIVIFVIVNIASVFISVMGARYISGKMIQPIQNITNTAKNISIKDLKQRIEEPDTEDEVKELVITLNDMIARLDSSVEKQSRFVSDASHELRTPIAVIQGYINLIDRWGKEDKAVLEEAVTSIKAETEHMSELINQLLFLARAEKSTLKAEFEKISLKDVAMEVVKELKISNPDTTVTLNAKKDILINADTHLIQQLMWIFIQNALKYKGHKECKIDIFVGEKEKMPCFSVKDYGVGIKKENLDKIFDRFFREDESRNKEIDGNGLGLSIGMSIAELHKAKINVESTEGEFTEFTVTFPQCKV